MDGVGKGTKADGQLAGVQVWLSTGLWDRADL